MINNCIILLGPTAVGKTAVGVRIAALLDGEIISADSRQVYLGLDIGSGKDLEEYTLPAGTEICGGQVLSTSLTIPYHLIDQTDLSQEYNVFSFLNDAYYAFGNIRARSRMPVIVGGTGMYLDGFIRGYDFNNDSHGIIKSMQLENNPRHRTHRGPSENLIRPEIHPLILGTTFPRDMLRQNIAARLKKRLDQGMITEVEGLHGAGVSWERLERLGLEYRCVALFLQGKLTDREGKNSNDVLFCALNRAILQFAKRQETWFRGIERRGHTILWLPAGTVEERTAAALHLIHRAGLVKGVANQGTSKNPGWVFSDSSGNTRSRSNSGGIGRILRTVPRSVEIPLAF
ncbi:MAG: tRNA (adenosine(37)-N6)-dimethylallyltransferase MiaA [Spirochaetaceae bacterium]|jgi:tRNA dimethylallyltransferase|nr:tRNA (adenosine(37)-N6)-dimethylallyltransferase MiaA [Spirochaetaceae bacterium]